jgi:hypothetical protein
MSGRAGGRAVVREGNDRPQSNADRTRGECGRGTGGANGRDCGDLDERGWRSVRR